MDFARCPATSSVDWNFLRGEINAWSSKARDNAPMRWMVLCIFSNWIARIPKVWDGCLVGASLACLHASFCSEPGQQRSQLFQQVINGVSLQGWPGLVLEAGAADWPIFELVAAHGAVLKSGRWTGEDDLFLEPPECTKLTRGDDPIYWEASLVTMDRALDVVETGELYLEAPEIIFALNLLCSSQMVLNFASATACALKALAAPAELRSNLLSASERAAVGCLGKASMVTALLQSPWPLAHLLGRLRPKTAATAESQAASRQGLFWQPVALPLASSATTFEQSRDAAFPWVQFVARAVPPERLIMELPWPEVSDFLEMQREAIDLLSQFPVTNYPSPSNDRQTWKTLCLVCKDGLQDPQATEGTVYAKTEILPSAPALERFVDLRQSGLAASMSMTSYYLDPGPGDIRDILAELGTELEMETRPYKTGLGEIRSDQVSLLRAIGGWRCPKYRKDSPSQGYSASKRLAGRLENRELQHFLQEEHHVFFQAVLRDGLVDSTDEAIIAELRSLAEISFTDGVALLTADKDFAAAVKEVTAAGKHMIVILPVGRPGPTQLYQANPATEVVALKPPAKLDVFEKVKAILHPDGTGEVQRCQLLRPEEPYAQLDRVLVSLTDLGFYRSQDVFWNPALVKFWVAQSFTDDLPVHPAWLLLDTVAKKLFAEPSRWKKSELEMAYILPGTPPIQLSNPQKKLFGSRMDMSIFQGGGPLVLPDHPALVEEVLTKLGYLADGDLTEAVLAFCNRSPNKSKLRKMSLLPSAGDTFSDLLRKLREAFLSHNVSNGRVRLSVVLPGGMIAWHPDARVVEHGRLILHVPIKTNPGVLHWADYSIPHSVFNAGSEPRVHLIIDVVARDNAEFRRNFLQRMAPEVLEEFMANAMPPLDPTVTEASAVGPPGTSFARPLSRQMSDSFTALTGFPEMLDLERRIWQQVSEAYIAQALRCQAGGVCQEDQPNMPCRKAKDTSQ
eukprot:symbB.v1.2.027350.t2/scaffold2783.1/size70499/3